jgi:hypothetical protein
MSIINMLAAAAAASSSIWHIPRPRHQQRI